MEVVVAPVDKSKTSTVIKITTKTIEKHYPTQMRKQLIDPDTDDNNDSSGLNKIFISSVSPLLCSNFCKKTLLNLNWT